MGWFMCTKLCLTIPGAAIFKLLMKGLLLGLLMGTGTGKGCRRRDTKLNQQLAADSGCFKKSPFRFSMAAKEFFTQQINKK